MVVVMSLVHPPYDFIPENSFFLHFLITEYDDSLRAVYESLTYPDPLLPK